MILKKDYLYRDIAVKSPSNDLLKMTYSNGIYRGPNLYIYPYDVSNLDEYVSHEVSIRYSRTMRLFLSSYQLTSVWMINSQFR